MRILLIGGSNTGMENGWADFLPQLLPEDEIDNHYLGVIGSLFGLLKLLRLNRERRLSYDVVVFEYALNDILMMQGAIDAPFLETVLDEVLRLCARAQMGFLFLCLTLRPANGAGPSPGAMAVQDIYTSVAKRHGVAFMTQQEILGRISFADYVNKVHLAAEPSRRIAEAVAKRLQHAVPVPSGADGVLAFSYFDATDARLTGPVEPIDLTTAVYEGPFLRMQRGGSAYWPCRGRLVALMLRSIAESGYYRISAGPKAYRKNSQLTVRAMLPKLVTLQYVRAALDTGDGFTIDMPSSEDVLMSVEPDHAFLERIPTVPYSEQRLELNGILVWRNAS